MFSISKKRLFVFLIPFIIGCSVKQIDFEPHNFSDEVQPLQNLIFKFNTKIVDEKELNQWKTAKYLKFEPPIQGKYKWISQNELVFSPITPLSPSTQYKVKLQEIPMTVTPEENKLPLSQKLIEFHTPYLCMADAVPYWAKSHHQPELRLILMFNYEITPEILQDKLEIWHEKQKLSFFIVTSTKSSQIELSLQNVSIQEVIQPITIKLLKGINLQGANFSSNEDFIFETQIPSKDFEILKTEHQHDGFLGTFTLYANQAFEEMKDWKEWISIEPKIPFEVSIHQNQLQLQAEFIQQQTYTIKLFKGLNSSLGNPLKDDYNSTIEFGEVGKFIKFANQNALYLNAKGNKKVGLHVLNVEQFKVRVYKVFENNLTSFMKSNQYYDDYSYYQTENGALAYEKSYELKDLQKMGNIYALDLDFENILPSYHGIYYVEVSSEDEYYASARKFVCITDIGLMAKANKQEIIVFANSLSNAQPLQDLEIRLYSSNNQIMGTAKTGPGGIAIIKNINVQAKYFEPAMITASSKEDFSFLWFHSTRWDNVDYDVDGKKLKNENYDAMIYAERPIYRPGETAHFNAIVRTTDWKNVHAMPVTFKIINPRNQTVYEELKPLDTQSTLQIDYEIPRSSPTGNYTCLLYAGDSELIQSYVLTVEEFVPDRLKVNAYVKDEFLKAPQEVQVNLQAFHLYGSPAVNYNYEVMMTFKPQIFTPKGFDKYHFDLKNSSTTFGTLVANGKTDAEGNALASLKIPENWQNTGLLTSNISTAVFDENNRPVYHNISKNIYTQNLFFGIYRFDSYVNSNAPLSIPIIAVDYNGKLLNNIPAKVQIIYYTYETVIQRVYYSTSFQTIKKSKKVYEKILTLNGEKELLNFTPSIGGEYEIRVMAPGIEKSYVSYTFYAYGFWGNMTSFETDPKGRIIIESNKNPYDINEKAKILFKTPFEGKLIVTIERNKLFNHYILQTKNQTASLELNLREQYVPNVFVCATLIRPYINNDLPLMVAHGAHKLVVENFHKKLNVKILAQNKVKSRTQQTITIQTRPYAHVTLAAVDEGILQIKNSKTPNPYEYFYGPQALTVQQFDVYAKILKEIGGFKKNSKAGGGGAESYSEFAKNEDTRRMNPIMNNPANKFVSFWKYGHADANGLIKFNINIPAFSGSLRLMAQAYFNDQFGANEKRMIVADPVVLNMGSPLFASPGDTLLIPITLHNTTAQTLSANILLTSNNLLTIKNLTNSTFTLNPNQEQKAFAKIAVGQQLGIAKIQLKAKAGNETYMEESEIAIRPSSPLVYNGKGGWVDGGKSLQISIDNYNFLAGTQQYQLVVSTNPVAQFSKNLNELIQYPHGCAEQTISIAFPQIYVQDLSRGLLKKQKLRSNPSHNVQAAISKIEQLVDYTGGIHYWENSYVSWWTTVYAAHFLKEAQNNGFEINKNILQQITKYLYSQVNQNFALKNNRFYPRELAYSLYVLALIGKPNIPKMNFYKSQLDKFTPDSKILLGCAFGLSGDWETFEKIIQTPFEYIPFDDYDLDFSTSLRERALILNTLLDVQPNHSLVSAYLSQIMSEVQNAKYLNTQELSFSLMALAKFANINKNANISANVLVNGTTYKINAQNPLILDLKQLNAFQIQAQGKVYYSYIASGVNKNGSVKEEDQFIKVRRTFLDKNGNTINGKVNINDLVKVQIEIQPLQNQNINNIVISDMIPSGFQIENERLNFNALEVGNQYMYDYKDIRDDRVNFYVSLSGNKKIITYYLRAVQRGTFVVPPIAADAMYDGNIHSYHGKGVISIE